MSRYIEPRKMLDTLIAKCEILLLEHKQWIENVKCKELLDCYINLMKYPFPLLYDYINTLNRLKGLLIICKRITYKSSQCNCICEIKGHSLWLVNDILGYIEKCIETFKIYVTKPRTRSCISSVDSDNE